MKVRVHAGKTVALVALGIGAAVAGVQPRTAEAAPEGVHIGGRSTTQPGPGHGRPGGRGMALQRLSAELGLTARQQQQIKPILESSRSRREALRANTRLKPEEKRTRMMELMRQTRARIGTVLTATQKQKWAQMHRDHQRGQATGKGPAPRHHS